MLLTAVLMFTSVDLRFQEALASHFPSFLTNPTGGLEKSGAVQDELAGLRGRPKFDDSVVKAITRAASRGHAGLPGVKTPELAVLGDAPEFATGHRWLNSPPLTMAGLRGRVVLVDFWTYTCINCLRTLPYLKAWDERYRAQGLTIAGVHTPEFAFERNTANVRAAIGRQGIRYPVVQDNDYGTWNAFGNQYWPAKYLIDARGRVRYVHFGEGEYKETEAAIRTLLAEAGDARLGAAATPRAVVETVGHRATPETYLGSARAKGFSPVGPRPGTHDYTALAPAKLPQSVFSLGGRWRVDRESARAVRGATISARVVGRAVYLVLSSEGGRPRHLRVELDGRPIAPRAAGDDVRDGVLTVRGQRLYDLVKLASAGEHVLTLRFDAGVSGFAFTFG
jgi:thiol-disulfide isomerase/thioredoxin